MNVLYRQPILVQGVFRKKYFIERGTEVPSIDAPTVAPIEVPTVAPMDAPKMPIIEPIESYKIQTDADIITQPLRFYDAFFAASTTGPITIYKKQKITLDKDYDIFVTSDIHADVSRMIQLFERQKLIMKRPDATSTDPLYTQYIWNPKRPRTAIVITGDFLDGKRVEDVIDHDGRNEIMIMALLYNLRIDALQHESYIFMTMGNHDFYSFCYQDDYYKYMHDKAIEYYRNFFKRDELGVFQTIPHKPSVKTQDSAYFARNYILARFYRLGIHFFHEINDVLFAHAGFHKSQKNIQRITEGGIQQFHLNVLDKMVRPETYTNYGKTIETESDPKTYMDFYTDYLTSTDVDSEIDEKNRDVYEELKRNSVMHDLFLVRKYQKNCEELDEVLKAHECKLLVVGHCPTCGNYDGREIFYDEEVKGIKRDCSNAHIVYSCGGSIITVDIALSYSFAQRKEFVEMLQIYHDDKGNLHVRRCRHYLTGPKKDRMEYIDDRLFNEETEKWEKV